MASRGLLLLEHHRSVRKLAFDATALKWGAIAAAVIAGAVGAGVAGPLWAFAGGAGVAGPLWLMHRACAARAAEYRACLAGDDACHACARHGGPVGPVYNVDSPYSYLNRGGGG